MPSPICHPPWGWWPPAISWALPAPPFIGSGPSLGPSASPQLEPTFPADRPTPARALSPDERASVLALLHEQRFQDRSPAAVQATLLDEGHYYCSTRTMYRILEKEGESGERRDQLVHPSYHKPELLATPPTNCGAGISPSCWVQPSGPTSIYT
jgi:hypothetical protein